MPKLETWLSSGSFGLAMMFVVLMVSFYTFLIGPEGKGPRIYFDPFGLLTQIISISGVPSLILAGIVFGFAKKEGSRPAALILLATAVVLIAGMIFLKGIEPKINTRFTVSGMDAVPSIFLVSGAGIIVAGIYLFTKSLGGTRNYGKDEIQ
jgi:hypothetical protein